MIYITVLNIKIISVAVVICWFAGIILFQILKKYQKSEKAGFYFILAGTVILLIFITYLWIDLGRPLFKTKGETRLWYMFLLPVVGIVTYIRWRYKWFLTLSILFAFIFLFLNYRNPEQFNKTLMPALQSPWFVPHVIVYMLGYALLGASLLVSVKGLIQHYFNKKIPFSEVKMTDNFVYLGFSFLTIGLLFGALWAKEAWGHYWTWDPKETWALLTFLIYLMYLHYRNYAPKNYVGAYWMLVLAFLILLIAWFGINYLPISEESVHTYN